MKNTIDDLKATIGKRIKFFRSNRGMTQMELARKIGYTSSGVISEIESGLKAPSMDKLQAIADALKVPVSIIVTPVSYDGIDKKSILMADLITLLQNTGDFPALESLQAIVTSELKKLK